MSYNYTQFVASLATMLVLPGSNADFQQVLPNIIDDGEQRIYRELDLLTTIRYRRRRSASRWFPGHSV